MNPGEKLIQRAKEIRQRLRFPPNAVPDHGIDLTRKSTAYKGDNPPPGTPPKKPLFVSLKKKTKPEIRIPVLMDDIVDAVCDHYGVTPNSIRSDSRISILCHTRRVVTYLASKMLGKSLSSIGRSLNKDHTSILHAKRKFNISLQRNSELLNEVNKIEASIVDNHRSSFPSERKLHMAWEREACL